MSQVKQSFTTTGLPANAQDSFARTPSVQGPRSTMMRVQPHQTTVPSDVWIPIYQEECLPGDTVQMLGAIFARLLSPLQLPVMSNLYLDWIVTKYPYRCMQPNWVKILGEQDNPTDSIDFLAPVVSCPSGGWPSLSLADYFGLPVGVDGADAVAFPFIHYAKFYDQWGRAQNVCDSVCPTLGDGPYTAMQLNNLLYRMKRPDPFVSSQPNTQKGTPPTLGFAGTANVLGDPANPIGITDTANNSVMQTYNNGLGQYVLIDPASAVVPGNNIWGGQAPVGPVGYPKTGFIVDMASASGFNLNQLRLLSVTQRFLEMDMRGGTRHPEYLWNHWGVKSSDARQQRVEFVAAGSIPIMIHVVPQTSESATTAQGNLAAFSTASGNCHFTTSMEEHSSLMVLIQIRTDNLYQQGIQKKWTKRSRFDFFDPLFSNVGEQPVFNRELYFANGSTDSEVWGYQEYGYEHRYGFGMVTGLMRYQVTNNIKQYNLAQWFTALPTLSTSFLNSKTDIPRIVAVTDQPYFVLDSVWKGKWTRRMPVFGTPGLDII